MRRLYDAVVSEHFSEHRQMLFLMGPRQVGKTTTARQSAEHFPESAYLNWDNQAHRQLLLGGPQALAGHLNLERLRDAPPLCILDEIHKYGQWKTFLKGCHDSYPEMVRLLVTGSARLDVFKAGGDSLMGRYFTCRMHPLSVAELLHVKLPEDSLIREPLPLEEDRFQALLKFGGFPEPFLRQTVRFTNRWKRLRAQQLFQEDLRDLTRIQELGQVEILAELLRHRAGQLVSLTSLANTINTSAGTIRRWLQTLEALHHCFAVRPWFANITRSLRKESKYYLWDWSLVADPGARAENLIASALLKAVQFWTDLGFGEFGLHFLRDKQKREVDFVVVRDGKPWFLVEVKLSGSASLSPHLACFQQQSGADHAFQVALDLPFLEHNCFEATRPVIVPARTFLAQLV